MLNIEYDDFNNLINNIYIKIIEHGYLKTGTEWEFNELKSPFNRLYYVVSGGANITNQHNSIELKEGNVYLIPLHKSFNYSCDNKLEKFYIHFRI